MTTSTFTINETTFNKSEEYKRRMIEARNETERQLTKELHYSVDLRHQNMIEFYRNHIAKLNDILNNW